MQPQKFLYNFRNKFSYNFEPKATKRKETIKQYIYEKEII